MFMLPRVKVFATSCARTLGERMCVELRPRIPPFIQAPEPLTLASSKVTFFSNDNPQAEIENVRFHTVVLLHTQGSDVHRERTEFHAMLDAITNAGPSDLIVGFPYFPFVRSDRKNRPRISVMGCTEPELLTKTFGLRRVLLMDPHAPHLKQLFKPTADEVTAVYLLLDQFCQDYLADGAGQWTVVYGDAGAAKRFEKVSALLRIPRADIDKGRPDDSESPLPYTIIGRVRGRNCLLIDDEIATGKTLIEDALLLKKKGAKRIVMIAPHADLRDRKLSISDVVLRIERSPIDRIYITDSIPVEHKIGPRTKFRVLTVAPLFAEAMARLIMGSSLSILHDPNMVGLYRNPRSYWPK